MIRPEFRRHIFVGAFLLGVCFSIAQTAKVQVGTVRFHLKLKGAYKFITEKNVKVSVNDSLDKALISDKKGYTGFLELPEGKYTLTINVDSYRPIIRHLKIVRGNGKTLKLRMKKIEVKTKKKPD
jgi:hypothetical protein